MPTLNAATRGCRPPIRVRPAPRTDPPYDDEMEPDQWVSPHQLTFEFPPLHATTAGPPAHFPPERGGPGRPSAAPPSPAYAREPSMPQPSAGVPASRQASHGPRVVGASGEARLAVRRFVTMCVEVLNGYRPAAHLRWLSLPKEAPGVVAQAVAGTIRVAELCRTRGAARTTDRSSTRTTDRGTARTSDPKIDQCVGRR